MILLFFRGGGDPGSEPTPTDFPMKIGAGVGLRHTDAVIHHRAPHRRALVGWLRPKVSYGR